MTLNVIIDNVTIYENLPSVSVSSFGYSNLSNTITQESCDDLRLCGMSLIAGSLQRRLLNKISRFSNVLEFEEQSNQHKALCWWLRDITETAYETLQAAQRYVLALMYYNANGEEWYDDSNWITKYHECSWYGISCEYGSIITKINLGSNNLQRNILYEFGKLNGLRSIDFSNNHLTGTLPLDLNMLLYLEDINLSNNNHRGSLTSLFLSLLL